jgi:hypothetical protein
VLSRLLFATAAVLLATACSDVRTVATTKITPEEAKELRIDASQLYKELRQKRTAEYLPVKPALWPDRFKKYKPLRVGLYRDGVALALDGNASGEQGIHITPIAMDLDPSATRIRYDRIQDGVYWYRLGK